MRRYPTPKQTTIAMRKEQQAYQQYVEHLEREQKKQRALVGAQSAFFQQIKPCIKRLAEQFNCNEVEAWEIAGTILFTLPDCLDPQMVRQMEQTLVAKRGGN